MMRRSTQAGLRRRRVLASGAIRRWMSALYRCSSGRRRTGCPNRSRWPAGGTSNKFNGNSSSSLTGNLYFPSQAVAYNGNFSGTNGCPYVVADTVSWSGSASFSVDCTAHGMQKITARNAVKLAE